MKKIITLCLIALCQCALAEKYQFYYFYKELNPQTVKMEEVFKNFLTTASDKAEGTLLQQEDPKASPLLQQYGLKHAPMPFVLAVAPNGAIMGGFPCNFTEEDLLKSFSTPIVEKTLKALQSRKLVLLCTETLKGVEDFAADPRYSKAAEVVRLERNDPIIEQLKIKVDPNEATTVLIAPPADVVGTYYGSVTQDQLISSLQKASSGCCPGGCCPGGCCK